jgi:hypothetical protein
MLILFEIFSVSLSEYKLTNWRYVTQLLVAVSEYFLLSTLSAVKRSPFFGIIVDLSTDRACRENMLVYVVYWDMASMTTVVSYLCCVRLLSKTAASIYEAIQKICFVCDLDMKCKLRTFCADGDNTMKGLKKGLTGQLRRSCDCVLSMHCAAHRHVLAVSSVANTFDLLVDLDTLLKMPHALFVNRPKLKALWELFGSQHGIRAFSFPIFNRTRWFSRCECVKRLLEVHPVLVTFLYRLVHSASLKWDAACPLLDLLMDARTVVMLHAVSDIGAISQAV